MADEKSIKEKYQDQLLVLPGVSGVGYNGSIIVYVDDPSDPRITQFIPKTLDGVRVIVKKGKFTLMTLAPPLSGFEPVAAIYADRTRRVRPVPGGVSIGHPQVTAGTLGCAAIDKSTKEVLGVTNNHVAALQWGYAEIGEKGDPILQPGPHDGGTLEDSIGELERWEPVRVDKVNTIDGAVFRSDKLAGTIEDVGEPDLTVEPYVGMNIVKSGRTSGVSYSRIIDIDATVLVSGRDYGVCRFDNQIVCEPGILYPGDSGSWIGETDTFRTVGIGFAGAEAELSLLGRATEFERLLNIQIVPPLDFIKLRYAILPFIAAAGIVNYGGVKVAN